MGMVAPLYYSAEMVRALPDDGNRYETVHGELLVTPAPRYAHQHVVVGLVGRLYAYLAQYPVGQVLSSPADISWAPDILVQPDVFVAAIEEARSFDWTRIRTLLLAIEVLSPSTARYDRFTKRRVYQEFGVARGRGTEHLARRKSGLRAQPRRRSSASASSGSLKALRIRSSSRSTT